MATKELDDALRVLVATPRTLDALSADLTSAQLRRPPAEGEWSANDVLAHLRSCADVWGGCIATMLAEDEPTLRAVNPRTWIERTDYPDLDFGLSLRAFTAQRTDLLRVLESLSDDDWARSATVTGAGKPLRRTVWSYTAWLASHERPHVRQIERVVDQATRS